MRINSSVWVSFVVVLSAGSLSAACGVSSDAAGELAAADGGEAGSASTTSGASGTSGVDGSSGSSGRSGVDASSDGASPPSEAGAGGDALRCGFSLTCSLPGQVCCVVGALQVSCVTGTTCPNVSPNPKAPGSAALACSGKESCGPGLSCCLDVVAGQTVSACQPSCASAHAQLCAPFTADPGCPGGVLNCSQAHINEFGLSTAYATCGGARN